MNNEGQHSAKLEDLITCSICLSIFNQPKVLPCNHSYCNDCLNQITDFNRFRVDCPICKQQFKVPETGFMNDFNKNQLIDLHYQNHNEAKPLNNIDPIRPITTSAQNETIPMLEQKDDYDVKNIRLSNIKYLIIAFMVLLVGLFAIFLIFYFTEVISCANIYYYDGKQCKEKKQYLEQCESSSQCSDLQSLLCFNQTCSCQSKFTFYNYELKKCVNKKHENEQCLKTLECLEPMICLEKKCQCNSYEHFDDMSFNCLNKTLFNSFCRSDQTCHVDLGLKCQDNLCKCDLNQFWSPILNKCVNFFKYGQIGCMANHECISNLICNSANDKCSCPLKSVANMCDCERNDEKNLYWNGTQCRLAGDKNSYCLNNYECRDGLVCLNRLTKCSNSSFLSLIFKSNNANVLFHSFLFQFIMVLSVFNVFQY